MLILYHFGSAICAQKVRIALAEKRLQFQSRCDRAMMRDPEYLQINPNGVVPTLLHEGRVLLESRIISEYLEDAFPQPPLLSPDPYERHRARHWTKQIDDSLHLNIFTLSFVSYMREGYLAMAEEKRLHALPGLRDPVKRQRTLDLLHKGHDSMYVLEALGRFRRLIGEMESSLASAGPWLAGTQYSLADADFTPYLHRLTTLGLDSLWAGRAAVTGWWERVRARKSYAAGILDWITPEEGAAFALTRARSRPVFERLLAAA